MVVRAGVVVARTAPATATLSLPGRPPNVDWTLRR
jgi:cytosine deaminase